MVGRAEKKITIRLPGPTIGVLSREILRRKKTEPWKSITMNQLLIEAAHKCWGEAPAAVTE